MAKDGVERKIYYYDVSAYTYNSTNNTVKLAHDQESILREAFTYIMRLNHQVAIETEKTIINILLEQFKYTTEYGDEIYIIVDEITNDDKVKFRVVLCRTNAFPFIEKSGQLSPMTSEIKGEFNIAEITHCVLFLKYGIMGAEFNFSGARPSTIIQYLPHVYNKIVQLSCTGKIRNDAFDRLTNDDTFSLFEIGIKNTPQMKVSLRNTFNIIPAIFSDIADMDVYRVSIKRRKTSKKKGFELPISINELQNFTNENRENIEHLFVSQGTYKDAIDLLSDKMVCTKKFCYTENKTIDLNEMYATIGNFFDSNIINNR